MTRIKIKQYKSIYQENEVIYNNKLGCHKITKPLDTYNPSPRQVLYSIIISKFSSWFYVFQCKKGPAGQWIVIKFSHATIWLSRINDKTAEPTIQFCCMNAKKERERTLSCMQIYFDWNVITYLMLHLKRFSPWMNNDH